MSGGPMDSSDVKSTVVPGDTILEAIQALTRVVSRAKRIAVIAKRRYERNKTKESEHWFLLASQEFYYISKLAADFRAAAIQAAAEQHAAKHTPN